MRLGSTDSCVDLGVPITNDLSWTDHVLRVTKKANSMLFLLSRAFAKASPAVFSKLYKTYVRPLLEFANSAWTPTFQRDILRLEAVQRRATRIPFGRNRPPYPERLALMNLCSLFERRKRGDLIITYQALRSAHSPITHLFPLDTSKRTRGHAFRNLATTPINWETATFFSFRVPIHRMI
jgi:hypothetical protein